MTEPIQTIPPTDTPQPGGAATPADAALAALASEQLERNKQRKQQRGYLFWGMLVLCATFYAAFLFSLCNLQSLLCVIGHHYHALWLIALLAVIPTVLLLALMKGVYRSTRGEAAKDTGADVSRNLPSVIKLLTDK